MIEEYNIEEWYGTQTKHFETMMVYGAVCLAAFTFLQIEAQHEKGEYPLFEHQWVGRNALSRRRPISDEYTYVTNIRRTVS